MDKHGSSKVLKAAASSTLNTSPGSAKKRMTTTQVWKLNNTLANKAGPHHAVYWVKSNKKFEDASRLGLSTDSISKFVTGNYYKGDWNQNFKNGFGTQIWPDGRKYQGDWISNKRHGKGTMWVTRKGELCKQYAGDWKENKKDVSLVKVDDFFFVQWTRQSLSLYKYNSILFSKQNKM